MRTNRIPLCRCAGLFPALAVGCALSACSSDATTFIETPPPSPGSAPDPGSALDPEALPAYVVAVDVLTDDSRTGYVTTVPSLDAGTVADTRSAVEFPG